MEREKEALKEMAQRHDFEIISHGSHRQHRDFPEFNEAAASLAEGPTPNAEGEREDGE